VGDKLEEQFKETNQNKKLLDEEILALKSQIEDVDAEINFNHEECEKSKE
jgi:peptidoglycan hydrolase CwlO-like protein